MTTPAAPPPIRSDRQYARLLGDLAAWEPMARTALELAGIPQPERLEVARPLGTYPTLLAGTHPRLVVKLFGGRYAGPQSHAAERAAYRLLDGRRLPVPRLVAADELFPDAPWPWPFLVTTQVPGEPYAAVAGGMGSAGRTAVARSLGLLLRQLHEVPLSGTIGPLAPSWDRFLALLRRRRRRAPADHRRWGVLPAHLCDQLDGWLPHPDALVDTGRPPAFVHGDLHGDHVFVDPGSGALSGVIDFTDAYAGDPRYDLVALHFGTFRLDGRLLGACLDAYGWGARGEGWPREMLAFTLLHDFNMFERGMALERFAGLDDLALTIWGPAPGRLMADSEG